jgi:hypothetical protein
MSRRNPHDRRVKMLRLWLRGLRKMSRRIEREARINRTRTTRIYTCGAWRDWRMSDWSWIRHVIGVRKGTIL